MLGALITFVVLFGLIKTFERGRNDLDNFTIGMVAVAPVIAVVIVVVVLGLVYPSRELLMLVPPIVLIGLTFFLLWKNLEIPAGRSAAYTFVVVLVNEGINYLLRSA